MEDKKLRFECMFETPNYGKIGCLIRIVDGGYIATFSDRRVARVWYDAEKQGGNKDITYLERLSSIKQLVPGKTDVEIAKDIRDKLETHNAKFKREDKE